MKQFYAHSINSQGQRHRLSDHLKEVATLSKKYDNKLSARDRAYWAGLWHDLGKYSR
ncbi:MAG: HD domain-containing protein [Planctomycetes bacterium]|nr:HD domain-containing protein [Planctomycetota bacterium]